MRNGVKRPANLAAAHVVGANVTRRCALTFADARALDENVLIHNAGTRSQHVSVADVAAEPVTQVDRAGVTERVIRLAVGGVERVQSAAGGKKHSPLISVRPICDTAVHVCRSLSSGERIEPPYERSGIRAQ